MTIGRIPSVEGGIQPTIVDAKGDLIAATAADTVNRLAVGSNDQVLVADSSTSTGLTWKSVATPFAAGKNKFINGDFAIWQRGTSISLSNSTRAYGPDRFAARSFFSAGSSTFSQQTFSPGTAPVAGYEGQYFARISCGSTATAWQFDQRIEDVRTFAGQTVTFSFWIKASANNASTTIEVVQNFGSGGSANVTTNATGPSVTTSWQRFSVTLAIPSVSGKTIGTGSYVEFSVYSNSGVTNSMTVDTWGWQVENGNTATPFTTATGTLQGELAACRRYLPMVSATNSEVATGYSYGTNLAIYQFYFDVPARVAPTGITLSGNFYGYALNTTYAITPVFNGSSQYGATLVAGSGLTITAGQGSRLATNGTTTILFTGCEL